MPAQRGLPRRHLLWRYLIIYALLDLHFSLRLLLSPASFLHSFHTYQLSIIFGRLGFPSPMSTFLPSHLPLLKYTSVLVHFNQCLDTKVFHSHIWQYKIKWKNIIDLIWSCRGQSCVSALHTVTDNWYRNELHLLSLSAEVSDILKCCKCIKEGRLQVYLPQLYL